MSRQVSRMLLGRKLSWGAVAGVFVTLGAILLLTSCLTAKARSPRATPTQVVPRPETPTIGLAHRGARLGETVRGAGAGWPKGATVLVELLPVFAEVDRGGGQVVATAVAGEGGRVEFSFVFPVGPAWEAEPGAIVRAWCEDGALDAVAILRLELADETPAPSEPTSTPEATPTDESTPLATPTPQSVGCSNRASFVIDVTVPDNTLTQPGQSFVKTWRLRNSGSCIWTTGYALIPVSGHRMGGPDQVHLATPVSPGDTVDVSVTLTAPKESGAFQATWMLRDEQGRSFGTGAAADGAVCVRIQVDPATAPTPVIKAWRGEYYANPILAGAPAVTRDDTAVSFNWALGAPATGIPPDGFSARWTRSLWFEQGYYRFHAVVDDGIRLYLDSVLVIDSWKDGSPRELTDDIAIGRGNHTVRVEYFERAGDARIQVWWEGVTSYPDWRGEYWSNRSQAGQPIVVRNDKHIDFNWTLAAPAPALPVDGFSVRWTREASFEGATYRFRVGVDDGARLWIDGALVFDTWRDSSYREATVDRALVAGRHQIRLDYYENLGDARVRLSWEKVSSPAYSDWRGQYWSNRKLTGDPALVRNDKTIDFDWGVGSAAAGLPPDGFSARWTRDQSFESGVYRFHARADDGVRLYLDGERIIDKWHDSMGETTYKVEVPVDEGKHKVRVEYYERTGQAFVRAWWKRVGNLPTPTPTPNRPPVTNADTATTDQNKPVAVDVVANDTDPDGDALSVTSFSATSAEQGTITCTVAGWCTYTPPGDFVGADSFTYVASDRKGGSSTGAVAVEVRKATVNRSPVAVDDESITDQDVAVAIDVLANDSDPDGDALTIIDYDRSTSSGGSFACTPEGLCEYEPAAGFSGADHFTYLAGDGRGGEDGATVSVTVRRLPVNEPPAAADDHGGTEQNTPTVVDVLQNDADPDGDALSVAAFDTQSKEGGEVDCTPAGLCTFTPSTDFVGTDRFSYTVSDGKGGADEGQVTIAVSRTARGVLINELMPVPAPGDPLGEWIELHNDGPTPVDLGDWSLAYSRGTSFIVPTGKLIEPGGFLVLDAVTTGMDLEDSGDELRLLQPDGALVDAIAFGSLPVGASYSRDAGDGWHENWPPSPGQPNAPDRPLVQANAAVRVARSLLKLLVQE